MLNKITPLLDSFINKHIVPIGIDNNVIDTFINNVSKLVSSNAKVLDAGAGTRPYKKYFKHCNYESTDIKGEGHNFICSLDKIPKDDNTYDIIICTQVLEHCKDPQKVINEFYRVLKPGGILFLTAPQGWMMHGEPDHYFNFTRYGLTVLFENAKFKIISISAKGGIFWYLSDIIMTMPLPIIKQFFQIIFFYLDRFDTKQKFTLGYNCCCIKGYEEIIYE